MPSPVERAVALLREGGVVAIPTETVYGLAADASNELAVRRVFAIKGRPQSHPLIVHVASRDAAQSWTTGFSSDAARLATALWPGPLTLVVPRSAHASDAVTGGQSTVALRVPAHPLAHELLEHFRGGLAAPSANRFGGVSPTTAEHVRSDLGPDVDFVLDGGPCDVGIESTIVDCSSEAVAILRPGGVPRERIEAVLAKSVPVRTTSNVRAPGMLESHYAPRAGVTLCDEGDLESRAQKLSGRGARFIVVSPRRPVSGDWIEAPSNADLFARTLYARLREIDERGYDVALIVPPAESGLGLAVRDRLRRAAAPRRK